jgi:serpin B
MLTRRQTLQTLGALGLATPVLAACGDASSGVEDGAVAGLRLVSADVPRSAGDPEAVPRVVDSMGAFTLDLWDAVGEAGQNLALSPYSIAVALAMTANGARGETAHDMRAVLHVDSLAAYNAGMAALTQELAALAGPVEVAGTKSEIDLSAANQLFGDASVRWEKAFLTVLAKEYGAGMRTVDFGTAEAARALVNRWTAGQTHDRIPEILPEGSIDPLTRLVLVDALYFKAPWGSPFEKSATSPGRFHRSDGSVVQAQLMSTDAGATYVTGRHFRGARLPYAGGALAMTVALPTGPGAAALRELLGAGLVGDGEPGLRLRMPRWTYRIATDLKDPLKALGMSVAFGDGADFSGMTTQGDLAISDVLHQTYVAVDEAGTEAAAATAVVMGETSLPVTEHELVLDRPFLYVIHDMAHGTPLFVGRVTDPT